MLTGLVVLSTGQKIVGNIDLLLDTMLDEETGLQTSTAKIIGINLEDLPEGLYFEQEIEFTLDVNGLTHNLEGVYLGDGRIELR